MKQIIRLMKARGALLMRAIKVAENDAKWWISFFAPKALIYYASQ
jgi:hypothetical protein